MMSTITMSRNSHGKSLMETLGTIGTRRSSSNLGRRAALISVTGKCSSYESSTMPSSSMSTVTASFPKNK
ncbi:uncharacterized protein L3040_006067 [Drepanopeziza brunnea f. sp. 'multigermtubi']|uniref:uncharacterized protein n=1 Tax=Drepanopeziza brunnea f. sp. 'multigermtubi' TaxID=698441 RepID=UPI002384473B|nr:hypothetical protein L3040_006067 [Drepanopeziza brunnea f. sp. 'multigermtubi']